MSGTIGFDGTLDYAVSITVPKAMVSHLGAAGSLAAGALSDDQGRLLIDLRVIGSAKSPHVALDAKATRDRLLGRAPLALLPPSVAARLPAADTLSKLKKMAEDSARAQTKRAQRAVEDTLKKAAKGLLKGLFGGGKRDTARRP